MLSFSHSDLLALLMQYGYAIIFPISILEGPVVAMLAGFLVSTGALNAWIVFALLMLGDTVGDALYYAVGRFFRGQKVPHWLGWIGITDENVHRFEHFFHQHHLKILLLAKTQAIGGVVLFTAGFARAPFWRYLWYNFLGSLPKVLLFQVAGFYVGQAFTRIDKVLDFFSIGSFVFAVVLLGGYFVFKRYLKTHYKELNENQG